MAFNPPQAFGTAFVDLWNVTAAFQNGGMTPEHYMQAAKRSHDTLKAVYSMTFWSVLLQVRDYIPEDVYYATMRQMADEENELDGLTPEERFNRMVQLIENTMMDIEFPTLGEQ